MSKTVSAAHRRVSTLSISLVALAASLGVASPAMAAAADAAAVAAADAGETGLTDIVVTAEKRETNLQSTPISISVLGADTLANRHVQSLGDLMDGAIPSLRVTPFFTRSSALTVGIRGIVPFDANQPSRDAGVGIYIDGVYLGRSQGLGMALLDIERIEVLKGPQGTLFGRNSTGGAVSIVSKKPSGELGLRAKVGAGNYGSYTAEAHLDLPTMGNIALKFDGVLTKRDGTVQNPMQGEHDFNEYDKRGFHAAALYNKGGDFTAQLDFDIAYDATTPYYVQLLGQPSTATLQPIVQVQPNRATVADIGVPQELSVGKTWGLALHMEWQARDWATLRSITSYRDLSQTQNDNGAGAHTSAITPGRTFSRYSLASLRQNQFSQELQLIATLPRLDYVGGLYYYHEAGDDDAWTPNTMQLDATGTIATRLPSLVAGQVTPFPDRASTAKADSYAAYGQATYTPAILNDMVKLTVGARLTHDEKSGTLFKVNGVDRNIPFKFSATRVDPTVTIALDPMRGLHFYGKWGTAYRAGGANARSTTYRSFGAEKVSTFEVGAKTEFWDRKARLNFAAYTTRYTDIQIDFNALGLDPLNPSRGTIETVNAPGKGIIKGLEIDATLAPVEGLTLTAAYAYTDSHLPQAPNPFSGNRLTNVYIVATPDHAYSGAIDYQYPVGFATAKFHLDANGGNGFRASSGDPTLTGKSFVVNGRVALTKIDISRGADLDLALWGRNLLKEQHTFYESRAGAYPFGIYNEPRTWGVEATLTF